MVPLNKLPPPGNYNMEDMAIYEIKFTMTDEVENFDQYKEVRGELRKHVSCDILKKAIENLLSASPITTKVTIGVNAKKD